jgi:hypothetical protein
MRHQTHLTFTRSLTFSRRLLHIATAGWYLYTLSRTRLLHVEFENVECDTRPKRLTFTPQLVQQAVLHTFEQE